MALLKFGIVYMYMCGTKLQMHEAYSGDTQYFSLFMAHI